MLKNMEFQGYMSRLNNKRRITPYWFITLSDYVLWNKGYDQAVVDLRDG